jgi:inhibitor of cysteine peptidase
MGAVRARRSEERAAAVGRLAGAAAPLALAGALVLLAGMLLAAGCGGSSTVKAGEKADGTTVAASVGDVVQLSLAENPTTGYAWKLELSDGLKQQKTDYVPDDKSGELAGSGGVRTWWIEVTAAGDHTVKGVYERSWEPNPEDQTYTLTIAAE